VTQQNASASEEMSATSEELASQSEELQASIAYFRTDNTSVGSAQAKPSRTPQRKTATPVAHINTKPVARNGAKTGKAKPAESVAEQQARAKGFAINMSQSRHDSDDEGFREYA
jgi:methyl-accepting chemotaxis protein